MLYLFIMVLLLVWSLLLTFVILSSFIGFLRSRVPYVPTTLGDIKAIVEKVGITSQDVFYDLGSGDGRVVFEVERLTGARGVGFELTWWTYLWAVFKSKIKNQKSKVEFKNKNFFKEDWSTATVIYGYLYPPLMGRVEEKFLTDCKPGTVAVIRDFPFPNLQPAESFITSSHLLKNSDTHDRFSVPSKREKFRYLLRGIWRAGRPAAHDIFIYRR